jgi:hypothetical protein
VPEREGKRDADRVGLPGAGLRLVSADAVARQRDAEAIAASRVMPLQNGKFMRFSG